MAETMDIYYMYEKEKHTAEIAAYHLDRWVWGDKWVYGDRWVWSDRWVWGDRWV